MWGDNATTFLNLQNPKNGTLKISVIVTEVVIVISKMDYLITHADNIILVLYRKTTILISSLTNDLVGNIFNTVLEMN